MIENLVLNEIKRYRNDIDNIPDIESIDCITIFPRSEKDYDILNTELLKYGRIVDKIKM